MEQACGGVLTRKLGEEPLVKRLIQFKFPRYRTNLNIVQGEIYADLNGVQE